MKFPLATCGQVRPTIRPVGVCVRSRGTSDVRTTLHHLVIGIGIIGSLAIMSPSAQEAPGQPQHTFRSTVDVVTIQASVRDARGRVMAGLVTTDFEVRDNGQLSQILSFRSDRQSPLSLAILVDMSGSMRVGPKIAMARQAYESVLRNCTKARTKWRCFVRRSRYTSVGTSLAISRH